MADPDPSAPSEPPAALPPRPSLPLLPLPEGGQPRLGEETPAARGAAQPPAHQTHTDILSHGAGHIWAGLQGRLQGLLKVAGSRLHPSFSRGRRHLCPHLRHRGRICANGGRRDDIQGVSHST
ncbi:hypothetical protein SKAU_G00121740 [Synaphobranchus kaupii]|uniref:Uncharacterized protein n=1 Tax=Synaphobranchus kaupii TaxID=118154 RepID=A0A9Q1FNV0_SYNKA|nr:hypothetical protein SKAU_G00121740 [Synaphobranchus kaupii]